MKYDPKNVFAGSFPVAKESGTAGGNISELNPVALDAESGKLKTVTSDTINNIVGIAAEDAQENGTVVYYSTGEFNSASLVLPEDVNLKDIKAAMAKLNIYLR